MAGIDRSATWTSGDVDAHNLNLGLEEGQGHDLDDPSRPRSLGGGEGSRKFESLLLRNSHRGDHGGGGSGGGEFQEQQGTASLTGDLTSTNLPTLKSNVSILN